MFACVCAVAALLAAKAPSPSFALPAIFRGVWRGVPSSSILGPWTNNLTMSVGETNAGDFVLEQHIDGYNNRTSYGHQRFDIEGGAGDTAGTLWYCGVLTGGSFFPYDAVAWDRFVATAAPAPGDTSVTFCLDYPAHPFPPGRDPLPFPTQPPPAASGCTGCGCAQWTLSVTKGDAATGGADTLLSSLTMGGSSHHLLVELHRLEGVDPGTPTDLAGHGAKFACNFSDFPGPPESVAAGHAGGARAAARRANGLPAPNCPFFTGRSSAAAAAAAAAAAKEAPPVLLRNSTFPNCYTLNDPAAVRLEWRLDSGASELTVALSADTAALGGAGAYVALGFRPGSRASDPGLVAAGTGIPQEFGMRGADVVLGGAAGGVSTWYAAEFTGAPVPDNSLAITESSATFDASTGRTTLTFTRPLVGGYLAKHTFPLSLLANQGDAMWAVGVQDGTTGAGAYHGATRGLVAPDWANATSSMNVTMQC